MTEPTKNPKKPAATGYLVTVKKDGFRRCGRAWMGSTPVKADELSAADLATLEADSMFTVEAQD